MKPLVCNNSSDTALACAFSIAAPSAATDSFMYMPAGLHEITPSQGGRAVKVKVQIDSDSAVQLNQQLQAVNGRSRKRAYFDFDHEDGKASFWPDRFEWRTSPEAGVYAVGEWTSSGKAGIEGKDYRGFSPVFYVDDVRANPARITAREDAKPNMGGLVNDPAFGGIKPFFARDARENAGASGDTQNQNQTVTMTPEEIAALRAKITSLEQEVTALKAKNTDDAALAGKQAELKVAKAELTADEAEKKVKALEAKNKTLEDADLKRRQSGAKAYAADMVKRGALAAQDATGIADVERNMTDNPELFGPIYSKWAGNGVDLTRRMTDNSVLVTREAPNAVMKHFSGILAKNAGLKLSYETHKAKGALAREAAAIFAKDIEKDAVIAGMSIEEALRAADFSDPNTNVGLLSGTLVLMRALPLMQYDYPLLSSITQDFSDAPGSYKQTETTRIVLKPAVTTYDPTPDASGRPKGWTVVSPAVTIDVPITLDEHVGVPIVFGQDTLGATVRNLFAEQAPQATYALGGYAVNKLTALMTPANFNAYAQNADAGGATTNGSTTLGLNSTAGVWAGQEVSGAGIPAGTKIASVTDGTHAVMTQAATATAAGVAITLGGGKVPTLYPTFVSAKVDFNGAAVGRVRSALSTNEVPQADRFALLNGDYYDQLSNDPTLNTFFAAYRSPEIITDGKLPKVKSFMPMESPWFPSSSNRFGFFGHKGSLALKSRLPQDFTSALGVMVPGSATTVTVPGGISVLLVQYISLQGGYAEWRPEVLLGAAKGDPRGGIVGTTQ